MLTRRHRWASGQELLLQINSMSSAQKPAPPDLQIEFFKTVVCVPLLHSAEVLELGTIDLIPESNELLAQILGFIRAGSSVAETSSPRDRICFEEPELQLQYRGGNISDSYGSSSSNSSVLSVKANSSSTTTTGGEVISQLNIMTPSSAMVDFEIDSLKQMQIDMSTAAAASLDQLATISDQHVSLSFSTSLVSAPPPTSLSNWKCDHKYTNYESSEIPFNMLQRGFPLSHDQDSLMELRGEQSEVGFPSYGPSGAPAPYDQHETYVSARHFIDNSATSLMAHGSDQSSLSIHDVGFKPWTSAAHNYRDIQMQVNESSGSLLKKCLLSNLPKLRSAYSAAGAGAPARGRPTDIALSEHDLSSSRRTSYGAPTVLPEGNFDTVQRNEAARQHMIAERERRRRQSESFEALRSLLLPNASKKTDKLTILELTLQHLKLLQKHVDELEQQKDLLSMQASQQAMINPTVIASQQFLSPTPSTEPQPDIMVTYLADDQSPLFHLHLNTKIQLADANDTIIKVLTALKQKKLHCIHMESDFLENTSMLNTKLLGKYKDGENITPSPEQILEIEEWWRHLSRTSLGASKEP